MASVVGHRAVDISDTHGKNLSTGMFHLSLIANSSVLSCGRIITSEKVRVEEPFRFDACKAERLKSSALTDSLGAIENRTR